MCDVVHVFLNDDIAARQLLRARSLALMESALGDLNRLTVLTTCVKTGLHRVDLINFAITSSSPVQSLKGFSVNQSLLCLRCDGSACCQRCGRRNDPSPLGMKVLDTLSSWRTT
jgi:hypothetical protein